MRVCDGRLADYWAQIQAPLPFCLLWRFGGNAAEVMLPTDGERNDFGSHFGSLFVRGFYAYGQLLTEIRETIKMVVSKAYFQKNALRSYL